MLEIAMDGVMAHIDGSRGEAEVATVVVRRRGEKTAEGEPKLGEVVARRFACVLGSPEGLAYEVKRTIREAGRDVIPMGEILGDGALDLESRRPPLPGGDADAGPVSPARFMASHDCGSSRPPRLRRGRRHGWT